MSQKFLLAAVGLMLWGASRKGYLLHASIGTVAIAGLLRWFGVNRLSLPDFPRGTSDASSHPANAGVPAGSGQVLRVCSHNVWGHYFVRAPNKQQRLRAFVEHVANDRFDVVLMQEMFLGRLGPMYISTEIEDVIARMQAAGYLFWTDPTASLPYFGQNSGLMIFSKYPIKRSVYENFSGTKEIPSQKGLIISEIEVGASGGMTVLVGNTHFDSRSVDGRISETRQVFDAVRREIAISHGGNTGRPVRCIVGGDFNIDIRDGRLYTQLEEAASAVGLENIFANSTKSTERSGLQIDHLFVSVNTLPVVGSRVLDYVIPAAVRDSRPAEPEGVSDHYGLGADLRLA